MNSLTLVLRIVAIVGAIAAAALFFVVQGKLGDTQERLSQTQTVLASTEATLVETQNALQQTQSELKQTTNLQAQTKTTLDNVQSQLLIAQQEVNRSKNAISDMESKVAELQREKSKLSRDLVSTQEELAAASREAEIESLNSRIDELEKKNNELAMDLEAKEAIAEAVAAQKNQGGSKNLGQIDTTIRSLSLGGEPIKRIRLETTVNSVSQADGMVVLDKTPELELSAGQTVILVQNLQSVGKVQIQTVTDTYAIANILPGSDESSKLIPGSTVQLLL